MAMAYEVLRARERIYGLVDEVWFHHPRARDVLDAHVQTINKILSHMNISCF